MSKLRCGVSKYLNRDFLDPILQFIIASEILDIVKYLIGIALLYQPMQGITITDSAIALLKFLMGCFHNIYRLL
jgi:hypothetical protein